MRWIVGAYGISTDRYISTGNQIDLGNGVFPVYRDPRPSVFTDGMTDCRNPKGEPFGLERIRLTMADLGNTSAQSSCDQLFDKLMMYQGGSKQDDDVTLVAVHAK